VIFSLASGAPKVPHSPWRPQPSRFAHEPRRHRAELKRTRRAPKSTDSTSRPAFSHALACTWLPSPLSFAHHTEYFVADVGSGPTSRSMSSNCMVTAPSDDLHRYSNRGSYLATANKNATSMRSSARRV